MEHHSSSSSTSSTTTTTSPNNPYPTTFVQADTSSFKQVVQMLTGSADTARHAARPGHAIPPIKTGPRKDKSGSKLYERRNSTLRSFKISPLGPGPGPRPEILSPSILDFPSLALSPVTPLIPDPFNRPPAPNGTVDLAAEDKAIVDKGFYLHPSPANTPRDSEPRLLPLFPLTSPTLAASSTAAES